MKKESFSHRLKYLLSSTGASQIDLAKKIGVHRSAISHYIKEDNGVKIDTLEKIANYFNVNPVWLMGYDVPIVENDKYNQLTDTQKKIINNMIDEFLK